MPTLPLPAPVDRRPTEPMVSAVSADDEILLLLVSTWELYTGRTLRNVPVAILTEQELIEFWADDRTAGALTPISERWN